jgi:hypothetical protein
MQPPLERLTDHLDAAQLEWQTELPDIAVVTDPGLTVILFEGLLIQGLIPCLNAPAASDDATNRQRTLTIRGEVESEQGVVELGVGRGITPPAEARRVRADGRGYEANPIGWLLASAAAILEAQGGGLEWVPRDDGLSTPATEALAVDASKVSNHLAGSSLRIRLPRASAFTPNAAS